MNDQRKQRQIISDRVDESMPASIVINKFGGLSRFCEITGFAISTVHGWTVSGFVPNRKKNGVSYQAYIMATAAEKGIELEPSDFFEQPVSGPAHAGGASPLSPHPRDSKGGAPNTKEIAGG